MSGTALPPNAGEELAQQPGWRRWLFLAIGCLFVGLAILGALLPILPCTPFALLASAAFLRSSPRMHGWLLRTRWFGPTLRDWHRYRGVRRRVKALAIALIVVTVLASVILGELRGPLLILLLVLCLIGITVVLRLPTVCREGELPDRIEEGPVAKSDSQPLPADTGAEETPTRQFS